MQRKLNYRFHNPNEAAVAADHLIRILIEANRGKVEKAIEEAANQQDRQSAKKECSA